MILSFFPKVKTACPKQKHIFVPRHQSAVDPIGFLQTLPPHFHYIFNAFQVGKGCWNNFSMVVPAPLCWNSKIGHGNLQWDHRWTTRDSDKLQTLPPHLYCVFNASQLVKRWWNGRCTVVSAPIWRMVLQEAIKWDPRWITKDSDKLQPLLTHLQYVFDASQVVMGWWKRVSMVVPARLCSNSKIGHGNLQLSESHGGQPKILRHSNHFHRTSIMYLMLFN